MGSLAEFFVATPAEAQRYAHRHEEDDEGEAIEDALQPQPLRGLESLVLGQLWAILAGETFEYARHQVPEQMLDEDGSQWLGQLPDAMVHRLAQADEAAVSQAAVQWAANPCMNSCAEVLVPCIQTLRTLAGKALAEGKGLHYWGCL